MRKLAEKEVGNWLGRTPRTWLLIVSSTTRSTARPRCLKDKSLARQMDRRGKELLEKGVSACLRIRGGRGVDVVVVARPDGRSEKDGGRCGCFLGLCELGQDDNSRMSAWADDQGRASVEDRYRGRDWWFNCGLELG